MNKSWIYNVQFSEHSQQYHIRYFKIAKKLKCLHNSGVTEVFAKAMCGNHPAIHKVIKKQPIVHLELPCTMLHLHWQKKETNKQKDMLLGSGAWEEFEESLGIKKETVGVGVIKDNVEALKS